MIFWRKILSQLLKNYSVCSVHFTDSMFLNDLKNRLFIHAVPVRVKPEQLQEVIASINSYEIISSAPERKISDIHNVDRGSKQMKIHDTSHADCSISSAGNTVLDAASSLYCVMVHSTNSQNYEEISIKEEPLEENSQDRQLYENILQNVKKEEFITDKDHEIDKACDNLITINNDIRESKTTNSNGFCSVVCNESLINHMKMHKEISEFKCTTCKKSFSRKSSLIRHVKTRERIKDYKCEICNKQFAQNSTLYHHKKIHTGIRAYKCLICNKSFTRNESLKDHMKIHSEIMDLKCTICNKQFTQKRSLSRHMKIHNGIRAYKCSPCNKSFKQLSHLKSHMALHSGIKDYKCEICNKQFARNGHLSRHVKTHNGIREFKCKTCNKSFTRNDSLKDHMKIHSEIKDLKCTICNKQFTQRRSLSQHMRIHNGIGV